MSTASQAVSRPLRSPDQARPIFVFDTECDLNHAVPREVAWCIMASQTTVLATYSATIARGEDSRPIDLLPDTAATSCSNIHSFKNSSMGDVTAKQRVPLNEMLGDLAAALARYQPRAIVGHNVEFDIDVVRSLEVSAGMKTGLFGLPRVCTMLATMHSHGRGRFLQLGVLHETLIGHAHKNAHTAYADTMACAACYWHLLGAGMLDAYDHWAARTAATTRKSFAEIEWEARKRVRTLIRSAVATNSLRRRAESFSSYKGGIDQVILDRVRSLSPMRLEAFLARYAALTSASSAQRVLKTLIRSPEDSNAKPETIWRCVEAYCAMTNIEERGELTLDYLQKRHRPHYGFEITIGINDPNERERLRKIEEIPDYVEHDLDTLTAHDGSLKGDCTTAYTKGFSNHAQLLQTVLSHIDRGDESCAGVHSFALPWGDVQLVVRRPSLVARIVKLFRRSN